jgi:hypothetical protein
MAERLDIDRLARGDWVPAALAVLLAVDLLFLPWIDYSIGQFATLTSGTGQPQPWLGAIAVVAAAVLAIEVIVAQVSDLTLPTIGGSRARTHLALAAVAAGAVVLKFVLHLERIGDLGAGAWLALADAAVLLFVTATRDPDRQEPEE